MWFRKRKYTVLKPPVERRVEIPDGLWHKCGECLAITLAKDFEANQKVCPKCGHHEQMNSSERIISTFDPDSFEEDNEHVKPADPLNFFDSKKYSDRLVIYQKKTGMNDAIVTGTALCGGYRVAAGVMEFEFVGGSMGSVVGEKMTRLMERAIKERLPVIVICASGGARMQEGILSLMQMAKTAMACARLHKERIPYFTVLTHPTTAGVMASFASLGDMVIAEPNALIGFAGPRVIQQTINQVLPTGFQKSEFVKEHEYKDIVLERKDLRPTLINLLSFFAPWAKVSESGEKKAESA